jgi:hypothetical protein
MSRLVNDLNFLDTSKESAALERLYAELRNIRNNIVNFKPHSIYYQDQDRKLEEKNRASVRREQASRYVKISISSSFAISSPFAITISCGTLVVLLFIFFSNY